MGPAGALASVTCLHLETRQPEPVSSVLRPPGLSPPSSSWPPKWCFPCVCGRYTHWRDSSTPRPPLPVPPKDLYNRASLGSYGRDTAAESTVKRPASPSQDSAVQGRENYFMPSSAEDKASPRPQLLLGRLRTHRPFEVLMKIGVCDQV